MVKRVILAELKKFGSIDAKIGIGGKDSTGARIEILLSIEHVKAIMPLLQRAILRAETTTEAFYTATAVRHRFANNGYVLLNFEFAEAPEARIRLAPVDVRVLAASLCCCKTGVAPQS
jgi:hypothetical protein